MQQKYDIITIGGSTEDISMYVDDYKLIANQDNASGNPLFAFDYGTKVGVSKAFTTFGGGAANTAVCASLLGLKAAGFITIGGDDRGRRIVANLKKYRVDTALIQRIRDEISGFSFIVIGNENEHVAFSYRAANAFLQISSKDVAKLNDTKWLFVTSMTGEWKRDMDRIVSVKSDVKIAWNPGEIQLESGYEACGKYFSRIAVLTMNKDEAIKLVMSNPEFSNKPYGFLVSSVNLLAVIKSWGPEIVVITNGEHGADAFDGQNYYYQPVIDSRHKEDTTGLGDCFGSSFVSGLELFKGDIKKALYLAAWNASSVIAKLGAQNGLLDRSDIKVLFKEPKKWKK